MGRRRPPQGKPAGKKELEAVGINLPEIHDQQSLHAPGKGLKECMRKVIQLISPALPGSCTKRRYLNEKTRCDKIIARSSGTVTPLWLHPLETQYGEIADTSSTMQDSTYIASVRHQSEGIPLKRLYVLLCKVVKGSYRTIEGHTYHRAHDKTECDDVTHEVNLICTVRSYSNEVVVW